MSYELVESGTHILRLGQSIREAFLVHWKNEFPQIVRRATTNKFTYILQAWSKTPSVMIAE